MFVSSTVNLRPDPSTHYSHSAKYSHALQEVKRFKHFFLGRSGLKFINVSIFVNHLNLQIP